MAHERCLYCYQVLTDVDLAAAAGIAGYHVSCSRKIFGKPIPPELLYSEDELLNLSAGALNRADSGGELKPEIPVGIQKARKDGSQRKFSIDGSHGDYILKPGFDAYKHLPVIEDLTMHLAEIAGIKTTRHSLISMNSGQPAYIARKTERVKSKKIPAEDMCRLTGQPAEHRYNGSYEQIAKAILKYSEIPGFDVINFYEVVIFCFLTGNNDMHLKRFSLLKDDMIGYHLSLACDLTATQLIMKNDDKDLALTLNGKKNGLNLKDFLIAMLQAGITDKAIKNILGRFSLAIPKWHDFIDISFLPEHLKKEYHSLIALKAGQIGLAD